MPSSTPPSTAAAVPVAPVAHAAGPTWKFDHINVSMGASHALSALFEGVMGLQPGYRPPFPFPGLWLYGEGQAMVHAVNDTQLSAPAGELRWGHVAFRSDAPLSQLIARLQQHGGLRYQVAHVPADGTAQVFVLLPGGLVVELDVPDDTAAAPSHVYSATRAAPHAGDFSAPPGTPSVYRPAE